MANEFRIKNGFRSEGNSEITGSLNVSSGITASLQGTASYALTASYINPLQQNVNITGNLDVLGSITASSANINTLSVINLSAVTSSITYITSSQLDVETNIITVNTNTAPLRYGGLAVADSGSSPITSGSLLFDSVNNQWIFIHQQSVGAPITSSVLIMGPQTFNNIGNEITIGTNRLTKGQSGDLGEHITSSNITDTGTIVSINSNTEITGSLHHLGTFYPNQIDWFSSSIGYDTGSYILTTTTNGLTTYANYQDVATVINSGLLTTSSFNSYTGSSTSQFAGTSSYVAAAGNNNEIQYNKAGSFAATASFSFIHTSQSLQHGETTVASGLYSHAEGYITTAVGNYSHTEGSVTSTGGTNGYLATSVTAGTASLSASYGDIAFYFANGSYLYLDDTLYDYSYGTTAVVIDSASFDGASTLIFLQDPSITTTTAVVGDLDNAPVSWIGDQPYAAQHAHAEGTNSTALGQYSHAEGNSVFSIGLSSHAEGRGSCAAGNYSHAEGLNTRALGTYSHAEGRDTTTIGEASHAEGFSTRTIGLYSHAEGQSTIALGDYSHAEGLGTIASGSGQLVIGQYNQHGNTTSLFVIGSGANDSTRADVFRVSTTTVDVLGNLSVTSGITGSLQGTASFATSASYAATASYVNGMVVKSGVAKGNSFSGTPLIYTVTFATQFPGTYTVTVTGGDARSWTVQDVGPAGFKINSNSSVAITNDVFWQAIRTGEFNM